MKTCFKCGESKPLSEFYDHPRMRDGKLNKCVECTKLDVCKHRAANLDRIHAYDRTRSSLPHRKAARRNYTKMFRLKFPQKSRAYSLVQRAVASKRIDRRPCDECGALKSEAHHTDYSRPLDVKWLCAKCHHAKHRKHDYAALVQLPHQ